MSPLSVSAQWDAFLLSILSSLLLLLFPTSISSSATTDYLNVHPAKLTQHAQHDDIAALQLRTRTGYKHVTSWVGGALFLSVIVIVGLSFAVIRSEAGTTKTWQMRFYRSLGLWTNPSSQARGILDAEWDGHFNIPSTGLEVSPIASYDITVTHNHEHIRRGKNTMRTGTPSDRTSDGQQLPTAPSPPPAEHVRSTSPLPPHHHHPSDSPPTDHHARVQVAEKKRNVDHSKVSPVQQEISQPVAGQSPTSTKANSPSSRKKNRHRRNHSVASSVDSEPSTTTLSKPVKNNSYRPPPHAPSVPSTATNEKKRNGKPTTQPTSPAQRPRQQRDLHKSASTTHLSHSTRTEQLKKSNDVKQVPSNKTSHARSLSTPFATRKPAITAQPRQPTSYSTSITSPSPRPGLKTVTQNGLHSNNPDLSSWPNRDSAPSPPPPSYEDVLAESRHLDWGTDIVRHSRSHSRGQIPQQWYSPFVSGLSIDLDLNENRRANVIRPPTVVPSTTAANVPVGTPAPPPGFQALGDQSVISRMRRQPGQHEQGLQATQQQRQQYAQQAGQGFSLFDRRMSFVVGRNM